MASSDRRFAGEKSKPRSLAVFWRDHGQSMSAQAEIRNNDIWKSVHLEWAVRFSGDGGQEGRTWPKKDSAASVRGRRLLRQCDFQTHVGTLNFGSMLRDVASIVASADKTGGPSSLRQNPKQNPKQNLKHINKTIGSDTALQYQR